jgi:hypothetical protein
VDPYLFSLLLGGAGLGAMALSGIARGGHGGHAGHSGHAGHTHASHSGGHGHGQTTTHASGGQGTVRAATASSAGHTLLALASPRVLFSLALGFGTAGLLLERVLPSALVIAAAAVAAVAFERLLVTPLWTLAFRFESQPAFTLESCVEGEATAVTGFDAQGQGLISIELDGRIVQVLGTLQTTDRELGVRVRPGMRLRVEDVNTARNSCTVSLL